MPLLAVFSNAKIISILNRLEVYDYLVQKVAIVSSKTFYDPT